MSVFKLDDTVTLCKKSDNFLVQFRKKRPDKQTDRQKVK